MRSHTVLLHPAANNILSHIESAAARIALPSPAHRAVARTGSSNFTAEAVEGRNFRAKHMRFRSITQSQQIKTLALLFTCMRGHRACAMTMRRCTHHERVPGQVDHRYRDAKYAAARYHLVQQQQLHLLRPEVHAASADANDIS